MDGERPTPREDGFSMPAEWEPHEACLHGMADADAQASSGATGSSEAERDYAAVANAIAAFEPVVMVCDPGAGDARPAGCCGETVEILPLPIDDSWMRDNGPIFVRDAAAPRRARPLPLQLVGRAGSSRTTRTPQVPRHVAAHLGMRRYEAPYRARGRLVLRGRGGDPHHDRAVPAEPQPQPDDVAGSRSRQGLRDYLGAETIVWLGLGHSTDRDTDGHIDGIALLPRPGEGRASSPRTIRTTPTTSPGGTTGSASGAARDARGRELRGDPVRDAAHRVSSRTSTSTWRTAA